MTTALRERPPVRLSKRTVDAALPGPDRYTIWDVDLKGFGLRVSPAGVRTYVVRYRIGGGRTGTLQQVSLGRHGTLTPDEARDAARTVLANVTRGEDPQSEKQAKRLEITVAELCDLYLAEGVGMKKSSTLVIDRGRIERHIKPLLGSAKIGNLNRTEIERFLHAVAEGRTARTVKTKARGVAVVKGGQGAATRTVGLLGGILSFAVRRGLLATNPVHGVERFKDKSSERFLTTEEIGRLGKALEACRLEGYNAFGLAVIRLLLLTGCRKSEIEGLEWSEVDLPNRCLRLRDSKTGAKTVPIGGAAIAALDELPAKGKSAFVFPAETGDHYVGTP
ncbi:MAG: tyrosine-type recombinase/integrase, partial [Methyloceanibacter sp.]|uniref:tyrosine-type recombinase/integrase n=1 Tax=Methyloceanibacter sp. TaxID=1965321 RepID=UPI003EE379BE